VQLKRSAKESWPRCPFFCMTIYLLTGSHTGQAALLEYDLKKCVIHHIILTWHQVITICFQIRRNTSVDWDFRPMISSSIRPKSSWMNSHNFSISQALKNSEIAINCRVTKTVIMLKNKCYHPPLFYLNRLDSKLFERPSYINKFIDDNKEAYCAVKTTVQ